MPFESRIFRLAKDAERPEECQDAHAVDLLRGIGVVADGVASALFSRQWAGILTGATVAEPPDPDDASSFATWLAERRRSWSEQVDVTGLAWFQKAKLPLGAFSTLLWVDVAPVEEPQPGQFGAYRLRCRAIGDSCLFHVRGGELVRSFPMRESSEFEADPVVLGSMDLSRDELMQFVALDEVCYADDLLVLCTDAVAEWTLRRIESGDPPDWESYWSMTDRQWRDEIGELRSRREMRYDDATLVLLRVVSEAAEVDEVVSAEAVTEPTEDAPEEPDGPQSVAEEDQWKEKLKSAGTQFAEGIELASEEVARGWKKWSEKAREKYRDKFGRHKK